MRSLVAAGKSRNGMKAAFLAAFVLATASVVFYFSIAGRASSTRTTTRATTRATTQALTSGLKPANPRPIPAKALSVPLFFEPNQGQTAPQVKFLARGSGYGLFLTADEAVLELEHSASDAEPSTPGSRPRALGSEHRTSSVIRMRLAGANPSALVSGASPMPGRSNYFIGNDSSKWHHNVPQFGQVEYQAVYPGIDLVYYGDQGQLEYDFRVAPRADPSQIALSFAGASAHVDTDDSGDLILSTQHGDVRFRAPNIYQPAAGGTGGTRTQVTGSFRQLADNKIGFAIGDYDHSRALVIDPTLSYSTYIGGSGTEGLVQVAVDSAGLIYVAGSTTSTDFPLNTDYPNNPPLQSTLGGPGAQNIFIAVINPTLQPPGYTTYQQLVYATYLGGSGTDSLAGVAVDANFSIYVAGTTNSPNFPTTANAFLQAPQTGTHGFLSKIAFTGSPTNLVYQLAYSSYLAGNGTDTVTGLAIDTNQNAYVTGDTTSTNPASAYFPANPNGFQLSNNATAGGANFFASKINTLGAGTLSMLYSTYFGGGYPDGATAIGGGIAVDQVPSNANIYITGTTNMLSVAGPNGEAAFPLVNAQQACLDQASVTGTCAGPPYPTNTDAFVAKFNPNQAGSPPLYATYLGGSGNDTGVAVAVDSSANTYVTGVTYSSDWICSCIAGFQPIGSYGGAGDAYIAKIGASAGSIFPLNYFTYLGGSGYDVGNSIQVDSTQAVHIAGYTASGDLPITNDAIQTYGGGGDAFAGLISTTFPGSTNNGDYLTYLGGSQLDQGTGIALDSYNASYVAGSTVSPNYPVTVTPSPFQSMLNSGSVDAFVSKIGAVSQLSLSNYTGSPSPSPVAAGTQVAFTYNISNLGPDPASFVTFYATVPTTGLASPAQAKVTSGAGTCTALQTSIIACYIPTLTVCPQVPCSTFASVEVDLVPNISANNTQLQVSGNVSANNGPLQGAVSQIVNVVDFNVAATNSTPTITAGQVATIQVSFCPTRPALGYSATITPSQTTSPSIVTAVTPTFYPTTVTLSGASCGTTTLSIATVARPINTARTSPRGAFYAALLPLGGLSLIGLGIGAGRKRRRWLAAFVLGLIAGILVLQLACSSTSTTTTTISGTQAGIYTITITGNAGTGASHNTQIQLQVN